MQKNIFSLSILTLSLLTAPVYASMEDELTEKIQDFMSQKNTVELSQEEIKETSTGGMSETLYTITSSTVTPLLHIGRWFGDWARGGTTVVGNSSLDEIAKETVQSTATAFIDESSISGKVISKISSDKGLSTMAWRATGNGIRTLFGAGTGETPTVDRVTRQWIKDKKISDRPNFYLPIIVTALFQSFNDNDEIINNYNKTITKINGSSSLQHIGEDINLADCFTKGYIRYLVKNQTIKEVDNFLPEVGEKGEIDFSSEKTKTSLKRLFRSLNSFGIDPLDKFSVMKKVTLQDAFSDKTKDELGKMSSDEKEKGFNDYKIERAESFISKLFEEAYDRFRTENIFKVINKKSKEIPILQPKIETDNSLKTNNSENSKEG